MLKLSYLIKFLVILSLSVCIDKFFMGLGTRLIVLDILMCYTEESSVKCWKFDSYVEVRLGDVFIV